MNSSVFRLISMVLIYVYMLCNLDWCDEHMGVLFTHK